MVFFLSLLEEAGFDWFALLKFQVSPAEGLDLTNKEPFYSYWPLLLL